MSTLPKSAMTIQDLLKTYEVYPLWDPRRTERTTDILPKILECVPGDILEIGAHRGRTTKVFCEVGAKFNRHVFVIDPWDGRQDGDKTIYIEFCKNTSSFDNCTVYKQGSEDPECLKKLRDEQARLAFILIDGLHSYDAVKNDLKYCEEFLNPHGILCIDDWTGPYSFSKLIQRSTHDNLGENFTELETPPSLIERYFVKLW